MTGERKRRRERPDVRRAQILDAAKSCFRSLGFQASTVDRIAAEAGVSVGLLYRFFESKSAMIEAIIIEDVEAQLDQAAEIIAGSGGDRSAIIPLITTRAAEMGFTRDRLALMFEIAAEVCRNPRLRHFVGERRGQLRERLSERMAATGIDREAALAMADRLDLASSIASGLAMHAMLYSEDTVPLDAGALARTVDAALSKDG